MIVHQGDYWEYYDTADLFLFTSNGTLTEDGRLVMGAGTALQVKKKFPGIDFTIGSFLSEEFTPVHNRTWRRDYYFTVSPSWESNRKSKIGLFQTKGYWKQPSTLQYIKGSAAALFRFLEKYSQENLQVHCPFPGIGKGGLSPSDVLPHLLFLPDNVHFWVYEKETFSLINQLLESKCPI